MYIYLEDVRDYLNYVLYNNQDTHLTGICKARDLSHWSKETHSFIADLFFCQMPTIIMVYANAHKPFGRE